MHKCSKHQGPHAQVIHMDLDHVINSIAVIGNMKLWSQVICWCYQHCCWTQSVFKIPSPFHFGVSQMKFSFGFPGCFTQRISPILLPMPASNWKAGFQSSLVHGAPLPLLGGVGGVRRPGGLQHRSAGSQKPGRRATYPSEKYPVRLTLGLGEGQVPTWSLSEAEVGLQQAPCPALLFGRTWSETAAVQPRDGAAVWDAQNGRAQENWNWERSLEITCVRYNGVCIWMLTAWLQDTVVRGWRQHRSWPQ